MQKWDFDSAYMTHSHTTSDFVCSFLIVVVAIQSNDDTINVFIISWKSMHARLITLYDNVTVSGVSQCSGPRKL